MDRTQVFLAVLHKAEPGVGSDLNTYFSNTGKSMQTAANQVQAGNYQQALSQMWQSNPELFTTIIAAILGALFNKDNRWAGALGGAGIGGAIGYGIRKLPQVKQWAGNQVKDVMQPAADDIEARVDRKIQAGQAAARQTFNELAEAVGGLNAKNWKPGDKPLAAQAGEQALRGAIDAGKAYGSEVLKRGSDKLRSGLRTSFNTAGRLGAFGPLGSLLSIDH